MEGFEVAAVEDAALKRGMDVSDVWCVVREKIEVAYFTPDIGFWDEQVVVFGWCRVAHVFLYNFLLLLSMTGALFCQWEELVVSFGEAEELESVKEHGEGDIFEGPH